MSVGRDGRTVIPVSDIAAGLNGSSGVVMAQLARDRTGRGAFTDMSMHTALLASMLTILGPSLAEGRQPIAADECTTGASASYVIYDTADGQQIVLAGQKPKVVHPLLGRLGRPDLQPLFDADAGPHQQSVSGLLDKTFRATAPSPAKAFLAAMDLCRGMVNDAPGHAALPHDPCASRTDKDMYVALGPTPMTAAQTVP